MSTPINVMIDNKTVIDDLASVDISMQEGSFCNAVSLSLKSKKFWSLCDPTTKFGSLRIKVVIGSVTYQFLIEERDTTSVGPGVDFAVWGRSKQALLSKPYSKTITDTESTSHPWQTGNTTASAIVAYVVANYCSYGVTVSWNVTDFPVYQDSFSVSNQSPIDVISSLASVVGAEMKAAVDGSLSVEAYSVTEGTSVQAYNDLDDIVALNESVDYPSGYNAVTVYGYDETGGGGRGGGGNDPGGGGGGGNRAFISVKRLDEGAIYIGRNHLVRVYYYHKTQGLLSYSEIAACGRKGRVSSESITENVLLVFGQGNTSLPNNSGNTSVTGSTGIPLATRSVTYTVRYQDFNIMAPALPGGYNVLFYFQDKSASTIYSFTVEEAPDDGGEDEDGSPTSAGCSSIVFEKESPATVSPGTQVVLKSYGVMLHGMNSSGAGAPTFLKWDREEVTDTITLTNGVGSLSKPYGLGPYSITNSYGIAVQALLSSGTTSIKVPFYYAKPSVPITITYESKIFLYRITVPSGYKMSTLEVWGTATGCDVQTLSISISGTGKGDSGDGTSDITISVKDNATDNQVSGVAVYIDSVPRGSTDGDGLLSVASVAVGEHTIKFVKSGYQDSDQDDLANDSFTVA